MNWNTVFNSIENIIDIAEQSFDDNDGSSLDDGGINAAYENGFKEGLTVARDAVNNIRNLLLSINGYAKKEE